MAVSEALLCRPHDGLWLVHRYDFEIEFEYSDSGDDIE